MCTNAYLPLAIKGISVEQAKGQESSSEFPSQKWVANKSSPSSFPSGNVVFTLIEIFQFPTDWLHDRKKREYPSSFLTLKYYVLNGGNVHVSFLVIVTCIWRLKTQNMKFLMSHLWLLARRWEVLTKVPSCHTALVVCLVCLQKQLSMSGLNLARLQSRCVHMLCLCTTLNAPEHHLMGTQLSTSCCHSSVFYQVWHCF